MRYIKFFEKFSIKESESETEDLDGLSKPSVKGHSSLDSTDTNDVFKSITGDYDAVEQTLKAGVDPNYERGLPLNHAAKMGKLDVMKLLIKYGANITERSIKWALENAQIDAARLLFDEFLKKGRKVDAKSFKFWVETSDKITSEQKQEVLKFLDEYR